MRTRPELRENVGVTTGSREEVIFFSIFVQFKMTPGRCFVYMFTRGTYQL